VLVFEEVLILTFLELELELIVPRRLSLENRFVIEIFDVFKSIVSKLYLLG
jgi:hypothetical protein